MQKYINVKLYNNYFSYYTQLYLYNFIFASKQYITKNLQLNLAFLCQLIEILYIYNQFINIYKIVAEQIQSLATNTIEKIYIIFNP